MPRSGTRRSDRNGIAYTATLRMIMHSIPQIVRRTFGPRVLGPLETQPVNRAGPCPAVDPADRKVLRRTAGIGVPHPQRPDQRLPEGVGDALFVLAMGGGYVADVDLTQARRALDPLEYVVDRRIPAAMLGQGLGPLEDPDLLARAQRVLQRVDFISLRERLHGPEFLRELGVMPGRVMVTGDDAIELAYGLRRDQIGAGLGICLRRADYSPVADRVRHAVAAAVRQVANWQAAPLFPLIISEYRAEDRRSTMTLVEGFPHFVPPLGRYAAPCALARRVAECRVVVAGVYHLAVFALSQGIPVVVLSSSRYYDAKFSGLRALFGGEGLTLVDLDHEGLSVRLTSAIEAAWASAPVVRESLRKRAVIQIMASEQAFERVFELVEHARAAGEPPVRSLIARPRRVTKATGAFALLAPVGEELQGR